MPHWPTIKQSSLRFLARNRFSLPIVCFSLALGCLLYQAELSPPPEESVNLLDVDAIFIGMLEVNVIGTRENTVIARRDAGYAIEYTPQNPNPDTVSVGHPRLLFANELNLTPAEIRWVKGHGPHYRVGIVNNSIVSIASKTQPLIKYERYVQSVSSKRSQLTLFSVLLPLFGTALFSIGHRQHVHTDA